jgi:hypothetical protein
MNVQELKEYILKQLTPDEALTKLLEGGLLQYEKLKFDAGKEVHPIIIISMAAMDLGWDFVLEKDRMGENIDGLLVGTSEYLKRILKGKK